MSTCSVYVIDSDVFMTAARNYYAFDLAPGFWVALVREARNGCLLSIDRVKDEIDEGKDQLKDWANSEFRSWFVTTMDDKVIGHYQAIMQWALSQPQFSDAAKAEFADLKNADAWLVAYAKATNGLVVTNETYADKIRRRIKIPNACKAFLVAYVDLYQMMRALGIRLT